MHITSDNEAVAADVDRLDAGFLEVDGKLAALGGRTEEFVPRMNG